VDGMRADIVVARCAVAMAAWHGRAEVTADDIRDAARLALPHRRRKDPLDPPGSDEQRLEDALNAAAEDDDDPEPPTGGDGPPEGDGPPPPPSGGPPPGEGRPPAGEQPPLEKTDKAETDKAEKAEAEKAEADQAKAEAAKGGLAPPGVAYRPKTLRIIERGAGGHSGRRSPAFTRRGRVAGSRVPRGRMTGAPHLPATLRAAIHRGSRTVAPGDLRESVHVGREANLVLFVVDASGSMAARKRMTVVKTAVLSLLRDAYHRRDRVGMITFRGKAADEVLPPTSSHEVGVMRLAALRTGGRTPLAAGLRTAATTIATERRRDPRRRPLLIVVTDGRATSGPDPATVAPALAGVSTIVVDCESGPVRLGLARRLAASLAADVVPLEALEAA
jgi:magnesium chelatase subunit D